jgi:metallophosphoesterase superfamily enzyme
VLVKGNHDIIKENLFHELCVEVTERLEDDSFVYTHDIIDKIPKGKINVVGHIHPGVVLSGMGRQSIKLPCFYLRNSYFVLPAFGILTGLYSMERAADSKIFMVLPDGVKRL